MSYAVSILPEFDEEMVNTRRVIERIPAEKFSWKAHQKSNTLGWNVNHLAEIPGWVEGTINGTEWDFSPPDGPAYQTPSLTSPAEVLAMFDANVVAARRAIDE
jgi:hypothetical protein